MGTPSDTNWPGVQQLPDWKPNFPKWNGKRLSSICTNIDENGCELLQVKFDYCIF